MAKIKLSPARRAAFEVLLRIEADRAFSSVLLPAAEAGLSSQDRTLCHAIVLGTLRNQIFLDRLIDLMSNGKRLDPAIRIILRMSLFQLRFLDRIPDHSAVNEGVDLAIYAKKRSAKGFVNAILRRSTRELPKIDFRDEFDRISVETSHPEWLVRRWSARFGIDDAEAICIANNRKPPLTFRFTPKGSAEMLKTDLARSSFMAGSFEAPAMDESLRKAAEDGAVYFQDEASQIAANAVEIAAGAKFLDVCAAPGGKTAIVAERFPGSSIYAGDLHYERVRFLRENTKRQGIADVMAVQYDAEAALPFPENSFDSILLDAPCSGTGTIRHNPEIRYFLQPADISVLAAKQLRILENASKLLRTGGRLIYSTCSLEPEENEDVRERFLEQSADFAAAVPNVPEAFDAENGYIRTFPHLHGIDGFFIAAFERK